MSKIGYCRVSTEEQVTNLQREALHHAGCEQIFEDKISGAKIKRVDLDRCMATLKAGDTLVVWKLDRLGRSLSHLMRLMGELKERNIGFESLTEKIDTTTPSGELLFHVIGALAQFERAIIRERVIAGLDTAKRSGKKLGRPRVYHGADLESVVKMSIGGMSQLEISRNVGISQSSVSRILKERGINLQ